MSDYPLAMDVHPEVEAFFDPASNTISYVIKDPCSNACAMLDTVMDIDYAAGRITSEHADAMIEAVEQSGLRLEWIIGRVR